MTFMAVVQVQYSVCVCVCVFVCVPVCVCACVHTGEGCLYSAGSRTISIVRLPAELHRSTAC